MSANLSDSSTSVLNVTYRFTNAELQITDMPNSLLLPFIINSMQADINTKFFPPPLKQHLIFLLEVTEYILTCVLCKRKLNHVYFTSASILCVFVNI